MTITSDTVVRDLVIYPDLVAPEARIDRQFINLFPGVAEPIRIDGTIGDGQIGRLLTRPVCWHVERRSIADRARSAGRAIMMPRTRTVGATY